jgi:hypothetical protein
MQELKISTRQNIRRKCQNIEFIINDRKEVYVSVSYYTPKSSLRLAFGEAEGQT